MIEKFSFRVCCHQGVDRLDRNFEVMIDEPAREANFERARLKIISHAIEGMGLNVLGNHGFSVVARSHESG